MKPQPEVHIRGDGERALRVGRPGGLRRASAPAIQKVGFITEPPPEGLTHGQEHHGNERRQRAAVGEPEVMMDINTTPLIDVMLVLIIMLIITIPMQLHAVNLNMPVGNAAAAAEGAGGGDDRHRLRRHRALERRGGARPRRARGAAVARGRASPTSPKCTSGPNKLVEYKSVATVLASAQRLGVTKLGMIGNEQFVK